LAAPARFADNSHSEASSNSTEDDISNPWYPYHDQILNDTQASVKHRFSLTTKECEKEIPEAYKPLAPPLKVDPRGGTKEAVGSDVLGNLVRYDLGFN